MVDSQNSFLDTFQARWVFPIKSLTFSKKNRVCRSACLHFKSSFRRWKMISKYSVQAIISLENCQWLMGSVNKLALAMIENLANNKMIYTQAQQLKPVAKTTVCAISKILIVGYISKNMNTNPHKEYKEYTNQNIKYTTSTKNENK